MCDSKLPVRVFKGACRSWYPKYEADNNPRRYHKYLGEAARENIYRGRDKDIVENEEEIPVIPDPVETPINDSIEDSINDVEDFDE